MRPTTTSAGAGCRTGAARPSSTRRSATGRPVEAAGRRGGGVSPSGCPWKCPGRVSDSAIIGAGNYCENRVGAAACTGRGELAIRGTTARSVLRALAAGADPAQACAAALAETLDLPDEFRSPLQALCLTPDGRHGAGFARGRANYKAKTPWREGVPGRGAAD